MTGEKKNTATQFTTNHLKWFNLKFITLGIHFGKNFDCYNSQKDMFIFVNDSIDIGDLVHIALLFCIVEFLRPTADARLFDVKLAEMIVKKKIHYMSIKIVRDLWVTGRCIESVYVLMHVFFFSHSMKFLWTLTFKIKQNEKKNVLPPSLSSSRFTNQTTTTTKTIKYFRSIFVRNVRF